MSAPHDRYPFSSPSPEKAPRPPAPDPGGAPHPGPRRRVPGPPPRPGAGPPAPGDHAEGTPRLVQEIPEPEAHVRRGVELPTELADVGDPQGQDGHLADVDAPGLEEPERLVGEVVGAELLQELPGLRPPHPYAEGPARDVPHLHGAVGRQAPPHPGGVPRPAGAAAGGG